MHIVDALRQDMRQWQNPETALEVAIGLMKQAANEIDRLHGFFQEIHAISGNAEFQPKIED